MTDKMVRRVRYLDPAELRREGWDRPAVAVEFVDGTVLYASCDDEGNGPGALVARAPDGSPVELRPGPIDGRPGPGGSAPRAPEGSVAVEPDGGAARRPRPNPGAGRRGRSDPRARGAAPE